jgi:hypothetical protein
MDINTKWIWYYWNKETKKIKGTFCQAMVCKTIENSGDSQCGKTYIKSDESIGNAIFHLRNRHDITRNGKVNY